MLTAFTAGLMSVFTPMGLLAILGGVLCGIFVGVMPGLSSVMGMSIMLPVALAMDGNMGVLMMLGIFCGAIYGGSITAIMINTPGTANSAAPAWTVIPWPTNIISPVVPSLFPPLPPPSAACSLL